MLVLNMTRWKMIYISLINDTRFEPCPSYTGRTIGVSVELIKLNLKSRDMMKLKYLIPSSSIKHCFSIRESMQQYQKKYLYFLPCKVLDEVVITLNVVMVCGAKKKHCCDSREKASNFSIVRTLINLFTTASSSCDSMSKINIQAPHKFMLMKMQNSSSPIYIYLRKIWIKNVLRHGMPAAKPPNGMPLCLSFTVFEQNFYYFFFCTFFCLHCCYCGIGELVTASISPWIPNTVQTNINVHNLYIISTSIQIRSAFHFC